MCVCILASIFAQLVTCQALSSDGTADLLPVLVLPVGKSLSP